MTAEEHILQLLGWAGCPPALTDGHHYIALTYRQPAVAVQVGIHIWIGRAMDSGVSFEKPLMRPSPVRFSKYSLFRTESQVGEMKEKGIERPAQ